ncbi:MAG: GT4 family glycosyltransferase PelF [Actinomycetota bacterium]|nr:GT4 family glycosyltransferase PelF [Actinomycetota bacterium]
MGLSVTLVTEGTYPFHRGGVAVWCDRLIHGLSDHEYRVTALCATASEHRVWDLPPNVAEVRAVPLWQGPEPLALRQPDPAGLEASSRFLSSLLHEDQDDEFEALLAQMAALAPTGELGRLFASPQLAERLIDVLGDAELFAARPGARVPPPALGDAVRALVLLEHCLRPLALPPPDSDIVHATANGLSALIAIEAKRRRHVPFLLTEHGLYLRERYLEDGLRRASTYVRRILFGFFEHLGRLAYEQADFIAPGSHYNATWEAETGADPARVHPVPNGVVLAEFSPAIISAEPKAAPTLAFVGRIDPLKDVETLLRALATVHEAMPACRLRIYGTAPSVRDAYYLRCRSLADELGLGADQVFAGHAPSVAAAYQEADVVVLSSISEGLPYTVLEAMAAGKAVVATDVGGVREAVGNTGIVVPPRDPEAIAAACLSLLASPERRARLGLRARARVRRHFTLEQSNSRYRQLYQMLGQQQMAS